MEQMLHILIRIMVILGGGYYLYMFIAPNYRGWKNRRQPTITIRATVVEGKDTFDNLGYGVRDGGHAHYVTFHTAEGLEVTLSVSRETYWIAKPGVTGILTYQGTKCERFDPDT